MKDPWIDKWNERYSKDEFVYGEQPNSYLKEQLEKLNVGRYFFPQKVKDVMQFLQPNLDGQFLLLT